MKLLSTTPRRELVWYAAIMLLALALRVWDLGARSLWFDEATEYWVATAPLTQLAHYVSEGTGDPPLYSFLLHMWMKLGAGEAWLRSLSLIVSMGGVAGMIVLGKRLGGFTGAVTVGALAAINPADIRYAQEVGQYALMLGTLAWNLVAFHGLWRDGGKRWVIAWALSAFVATAAYYGAVFPVFAPFACVLFESLARRDGARVRRLAMGAAIYALLTVPVLWPVLPDQLARVLDTRSALAQAPEARPEGLKLVWRWLGNLIAFQFSGWPYTHVQAWVPIVCWFALAPFALVSQRRWIVWFVATWIVYGVASLFEIFPFGFRWGLIMLPQVVAVAGLGFAAAAHSRWWRLPVAVVYAGLVLVSAMSLPNLTMRNWIDKGRKLNWPETEDLRPVVAYWYEKSFDTQATYVFYGAAPAFAYYAQRYEATRNDLPPTWNLHCWHDENPPDYCRSKNIFYGSWLRRFPAPADRVMSIFSTMAGKPQELWIVFSHVHGNESVDIVQRMQANGYQVADVTEARAAAAVLLRLPSSPESDSSP